MRLPNDTLNKLKYIVWFERTTFTDLMNKLSEAEIKRFEKANGEITDVELSKAKIK